MLTRSRRRRGDQRGAVAVFVAGLLAVLLLVGALAIDLNMQRVAARDAQAAADLIAMDMARELNGSPRSYYQSSSVVRAAYVSSVARNAGGLGLDVESFEIDYGVIDGSGDFDALSPSAPNAVRVTARGGVSFSFVGGDGAVVRAAVAQAEERACLSVNSYAASLNSGDSWLLSTLLGDVLGSDLVLQVLDPDAGLANLNVDLLDWFDVLGPLVGVDLNAASFDEIANTRVSVSRIALAAAEVLERGTGSTAQVTLLRQLAGGLDLGVSDIDLTLGDLLELDTAGSAAVDLGLNVLDLVAAGIAVANGENVVAANLPINLTVPEDAGGPLAGQGISLSVGLKVGQKEVVSCAREVESSQISLVLAGNLANVNLGLARASIPLRIEVDLAKVVAERQKIRCTPRGREIDLRVASSLLGLDLNLGVLDHPEFDDDPLLVNLLGILGLEGLNVFKGSVRAYTGTPPLRPAVDRVLAIEDGDYSAQIPASTTGLGLPAIYTDTELRLIDNLPLVDGILNSVVTPLLDPVLDALLELVVNPLIRTVDTWLLAPLLDLLGLNLAGGAVRANPLVECGLPVLHE